MNPQENYLSYTNPRLYDAIQNKHLWFVHSINLRNPIEEVVGPMKKYGRESYGKENEYKKAYFLRLEPRPIIHHAINYFVTPFLSQYIWDCRPYVFVAPLSEFIGELYVGNDQDFLTFGPHTYSSESFLIVPESERKQIKKEFPGIQSTILGYNYNETLREQERQNCQERIGALAPIYPSSVAESETAREAVNNLFALLRQRRGINTWKFPNVYQYESKNEHKKPRGAISLNSRNNIGIRSNKKGRFHDVNRLLADSFKQIQADDAFLITEEITNSLRKNLNMAIKKPDNHPLFRFINKLLKTANSIQPNIFEGDKKHDICKPPTGEFSELGFYKIFAIKRKDLQDQLVTPKYKPEVKKQMEIILAKLEDGFYVLFLCSRLLQLFVDDKERLEALYDDFVEERNTETEINSAFVALFMRILYNYENRRVLKKLYEILLDIQTLCEAVPSKINPGKLRKVNFDTLKSRLLDFQTSFDTIVKQLHNNLQQEIEPLTEEEITAIQNHPLDIVEQLPWPPPKKLSAAEERARAILAERARRRNAENAARAAAERLERVEEFRREVSPENTGFSAIKTNLFGGRKTRKARKTRKTKHSRKH